MMETVKYEDLPAEDQAEADEAVAEFLRRYMCDDLAEAGKNLGISRQAVWDRIMDDAAVPRCEMPSSLQVR